MVVCLSANATTDLAAEAADGRGPIAIATTRRAATTAGGLSANATTDLTAEAAGGDDGVPNRPNPTR